MNKTLLLTLGLFLISSSVAFAHVDGGTYGTPKTYCESLKADMAVHDYASGGVPGVAYPTIFFVDGNIGDCDGDGVGLDFDGHSEWAVGGATLLSSDAGAPLAGATACYGEAPHHLARPNVWVFDHVQPSNVVFIVAADPLGFGPDPTTGVDCGDRVMDVDTGYCEDHCAVSFEPGIDGSYQVFLIDSIMNIEPGITVVDDHYVPPGSLSDPEHMQCVRDDTYTPPPSNPDQSRYWCVHAVTTFNVAIAGHVYT